MEVLGAVASVIAIGQAVKAGTTALRFLRSIPEIEAEWRALFDELDHLRIIVEECSVANDLPDQPESPLMRRARELLLNIADDIETLSKECTTTHEVEGLKDVMMPRKRRWLRLRHECSRLREKASTAKNDLALALILSNSHASKQQSLAIRRIEGHAASISVLLATDTASTAEVWGVAPTPAPTNVDPGAPVEDIPADNGDGNSDITDGRVNYEPSTSGPIIPPLTLPGVCPPRCACYCHVRQSLYNAPMAGRTVAGGLVRTWKAYQLVKKMDIPCTEAQCRRESRGAITLDHGLPSWLGSCVLTLGIGTPSLFTISFCLRPIRTIPENDLVFRRAYSQRYWSNVDRYFISSAQNCRPRDQDVRGRSLVSIYLSDEIALDALLSLWEGILPKQGVCADALTYARGFLEHSPKNLSDRHVFLLQKIISFGDEEPAARTRLYRAILSRRDIRTILQEEPWSINIIDACGYAPIHLAVKTDQVAALDLLIRAGADKNLETFGGTFPLALAAMFGLFKCAAYLVSVGCEVKSTDLILSPLAYAISSPEPSSTDILRLLLTASKPSSSEIDSRMYLLAQNGQDYETVSKKLTLLLTHGAGLDSMDAVSENSNLLWHALVLNSLGAIQCIHEAGARWDIQRNDGSSLLHWAVVFCSERTLRFLMGFRISSVDHRAGHNKGYDPWQTFLILLHHPSPYSEALESLSPAGCQAYAQLYQHVRDGCLQAEMDALGQALGEIKRRDDERSIGALEQMVTHFLYWRLPGEVRTYRTIQLQIRERMWEAAAESVEERMAVLEEEMDSSPWERPDRLWDIDTRDDPWYQQQGTYEELTLRRDFARSMRERFLREWNEARAERWGDWSESDEWVTTDDEEIAEGSHESEEDSEWEERHGRA